MSPTDTYPAPRRLAALPLRERPVQRIAGDGPQACNFTELLAALVGGGDQLMAADALVARFGDVQGLSRASLNELAQVPGLGEATAARLKAAVELGRRLLLPPEDRPMVHSPADAAALLRPHLEGEPKEHLAVLGLDARNRVLFVEIVYKGSVNTSLIRVGELFARALRDHALSVIVGHNHPSGEVSPSPEDVAVTRQIVEAGKLLDVQVLDHLILGTGGRFASLKERGLMTNA